MRSLTRSWCESYPAVPDTVPRARQALSDFAARAGASRDQVEAVELASSEAVTNAVLHGYRGEPGQVQVTTALVSDELWILVADDGAGMQPDTDRPGLGLGLAIIARLADDFAIVPRSTGGTEVRMRFDLERDSGEEPGTHLRGSSSSASSPARPLFSTTL